MWDHLTSDGGRGAHTTRDGAGHVTGWVQGVEHGDRPGKRQEYDKDTQPDWDGAREARTARVSQPRAHETLHGDDVQGQQRKAFQHPGHYDKGMAQGVSLEHIALSKHESTKDGIAEGI